MEVACVTADAVAGKPDYNANAIGAQPAVAIAYGQYQQPTIFNGPNPAIYSGTGATALLQATYQHFPLQGDPSDPLVTATNDGVDKLNQLLAHYRLGVSMNVINNDLTALADAFDAAIEVYQEQINGNDDSLSPTDFNTGTQSVKQAGLPETEYQFMKNAGISDQTISNYASYIGVQINLNVASTTLTNLMKQTSSTLRSGIPTTGQ